MLPENVSKEQFDLYLKKVVNLVIDLLKKKYQETPSNENMLLLEDFPMSEKIIYKKMQQASMLSSRIWCTVFFNFGD